MSRGQQAQVNREAVDLLNQENARATQGFNTLMPAYQGLLANPGYTPAQQGAITNSTLGGVGAAFGNAEQGAVNRAARTNNTAGLTSTEDALARQRMITSGNLAAENEANFADAARADRNTALSGIGSLFGANSGAANQTLGTQANNAKTPGFWDTFGQALAGSLGKALVPNFG